MLLLEDNAPVHTAQVAQAEAANCGFHCYPILLTHQTFLHLTFSYFLKSHLHCYHFGKKWWAFGGPGCHFLLWWNCNVLNIIEPSVLMPRGTILKYSEKLSSFFNDFSERFRIFLTTLKCTCLSEDHVKRKNSRELDLFKWILVGWLVGWLVWKPVFFSFFLFLISKNK